MSKNKMKVDFSELEELREKLDHINGDATKRAFTSALKASQQVVKRAVTAAMQPHHRTGRTEESIIRDAPVEWEGTIAKIPVGFYIAERSGEWDESELSSIFLMYGTKVYGQPHITPDKKLYNAVYGEAVRNQWRKIQEEAFRKVIERTMK